MAIVVSKYYGESVDPVERRSVIQVTLITNLFKNGSGCWEEPVTNIWVLGGPRLK